MAATVPDDRPPTDGCSSRLRGAAWRARGLGHAGGGTSEGVHAAFRREIDQIGDDEEAVALPPAPGPIRFNSIVSASMATALSTIDAGDDDRAFAHHGGMHALLNAGIRALSNAKQFVR